MQVKPARVAELAGGLWRRSRSQLPRLVGGEICRAVAAAGKAVYPLPLTPTRRCAIRSNRALPGSYESGGPTDNVLPIWKVAAPALDILAPDNYQNDPRRVSEGAGTLSPRRQALFVPETGGGAGKARFFFSALGLQAIGFSPFGLDYTGNRGRWPPNPEEFLAPWAMNYRLLVPMQREIARLNFEGKLQAVAEEKGSRADPAFGPWNAWCPMERRATIAPWEIPSRPEAPWWPIQRQPVSGSRIFLPRRFPPRRRRDKHRQFLRVEEGAYENGVFKPAHLERRRDRLGAQLRRGAAGAARLAGHLFRRKDPVRGRRNREVESHLVAAWLSRDPFAGDHVHEVRELLVDDHAGGDRVTSGRGKILHDELVVVVAERARSGWGPR